MRHYYPLTMAGIFIVVLALMLSHAPSRVINLGSEATTNTQSFKSEDNKQTFTTQGEVDSSDYHLFVVHEQGRDQYAIGSCNIIHQCTIFGYRWEMNEREDAEAMWASFAHPDKWQVTKLVK